MTDYISLGDAYDRIAELESKVVELAADYAELVQKFDEVKDRVSLATLTQFVS